MVGATGKRSIVYAPVLREGGKCGGRTVGHYQKARPGTTWVEKGGIGGKKLGRKEKAGKPGGKKSSENFGVPLTRNETGEKNPLT